MHLTRTHDYICSAAGLISANVIVREYHFQLMDSFGLSLPRNSAARMYQKWRALQTGGDDGVIMTEYI